MMALKRWQQVESLFHAALMRKGGERGKFLSEECSSDQTLRVEVESLIAAHERTGPTDLPIQDVIHDLIQPADPYLPPGQLINHYRIIGLIGKGGMGEVYKAEDTRLMRTVAIKVFPKQACTKLEAESAYLREARAGSAINHPNIVTIHEIGETQDITYIIMEYVEAQSLSELIGSRALNSEQILSIGIQICGALAEVHSRQIIHRDVKPANVMVTRWGQVKLLDFGIARPLHHLTVQQGLAPDSKVTKYSSDVVGTVCYMSPEQIRGERLDERTDIFSFGVLLYEMITGNIPFTGDRVIDVAESILKKAPADFGPGREGLPEQACDIVRQCLEKERVKRPPSFINIRRKLEELRLETRALLDQQLDHQPGSLTEGTSISEFTYRPMAPPHPIILVLPIESIGSGGVEEPLGLGLSYMISTNLARIKGLSVISKAAVERQAERLDSDAGNLARELGATLVMEGEMIWLMDGYAVMVRLSEAATGHIIWGHQYFGDSSGLFKIQQALCRDMASVLGLDISPSDQQRIVVPSTDDLGAFELFSQARALLDRYDVKENIDEAIKLLEAAVIDHPRFALLFAGLSEAYWRKYLLALDESLVTKAIAACDRALVLDPHQPEVHISLANI